MDDGRWSMFLGLILIACIFFLNFQISCSTTCMVIYRYIYFNLLAKEIFLRYLFTTFVEIILYIGYLFAMLFWIFLVFFGSFFREAEEFLPVTQESLKFQIVLPGKNVNPPVQQLRRFQAEFIKGLCLKLYKTVYSCWHQN